MTTYIMGCDTSHYQQRPSFAQLQEDGIEFCYIKAAENLAVDPDFEWTRQQAEDFGMPWFPYVFLRPGDNDATIAHFISVIGKNLPGVLDWETAGVISAVMERWIGQLEGKTGRIPLCYYGRWPVAPVSPAIARCPRILPEYPANPNSAPMLPLWDGTGPVPTDWSQTALIWQYSGTGHLGGIAPEIDLNRISCPLETLRTWRDTGKLVSTGPSVAPTPADSPATPAANSPRILRQHMTGPDVKEMQMLLGKAGYQITADGSFGPATLTAVDAYQRAHGLGVDGVVGPATMNLLRA